MNTADKLNALMTRVYDLEDLFETAKAEDDRWTANMCLLELDEINATLDKLEREHWYNNGMQDDPQDKLLDILQTEGVIDLDIFDNLVDEMLIKHHDYTIDDIENMSNDDARERVEEIFGMKLSEEDNKVYLLEYINAFTA